MSDPLLFNTECVSVVAALAVVAFKPVGDVPESMFDMSTGTPTHMFSEPSTHIAGAYTLFCLVFRGVEPVRRRYCRFPAGRHRKRLGDTDALRVGRHDQLDTDGGHKPCLAIDAD